MCLGGGAPPVVWRRALALGESLPAFGTENYELTPEEEGGAADTQAGSHPFQLTSTLTFNTKAAPVFNYQHNEVLPEVQPIALTKDLRFDLPPGLVGNPTPLPKCSMAVFLNASPTSHCPDDTVVGVATPIVTNVSIDPYVPYALSSPLYSLEPSVGEPARFGFTTPIGAIVLDTAVQTGGNYGVVVTVPDIPDEIGFIGSQVTFWGVPADSRHDTSRGECLDPGKGDIQAYLQLEREGKPLQVPCSLQEKPRPFLIMPTSCTGPLQTSVEGDSWSEIGRYAAPKRYTFANLAGEPVAQDGCNRLNFEPSISVAPDGQQASTPTGLAVGVHVDQEASLNPTGLSEANVKDTTVTLPAGVGLNPAGADGLSACGLLKGTEPAKEGREERGEEPGINLETPQQANCPESSKVATVSIKTPLLPEPLEGAVYLAAQNANPFGSLIALYLVAYNPVSGVRVKLAGEVQPNPVTGQLVSTFKETPQLPFEDLSLHFFGGSRAPLGSPALCGSYTTTASISPWSGNAAAESSSSFDVTSGPEVQTPSGPVRTPCADPLPFAPSLTGGALNLQAGAFSPFTLTMTRKPGEQNLQSVEAKLPPGLSVCCRTSDCARTAGQPRRVRPRHPDRRNDDLCGAGWRSLHGRRRQVLSHRPLQRLGCLHRRGIWLCAVWLDVRGSREGRPVRPGAQQREPAGEDACDCVIVRGKIEINPVTTALTITSNPPGTPDSIPTSIEGIPLEIQHVNAITTRGNFQFNPTNCSKMEVTGTIHSSAGGTDEIGVPFQVTNCASLGFAPKFKVSTSGKTSRLEGASLSVKLSYPAAPFGTQANIHEVKVELPEQLPSRLPTLQKACLAATFETNPAGCPPASIVGHAKALTPLIPVPLEGPAYFVSHGGEGWPSLIVVLQGYGITIDLVGTTFISKAGVTSSTFKTVPDQPVTSFELTLPKGPYSALTALGNLCASTKTVTVKKKITLKIHGRKKTITRGVKQTEPATLAMPTEFVAQNGAEIHQDTPITVTGCPEAAHPKKAGKRRSKKAGKKK